MRIDLPFEARIQDVFRSLANDQSRTQAIVAEVQTAYDQGRKVLVLTERTEHVDALQAALVGKVPFTFVLHGRMPRKLRTALIKEFDALPSDAPRVLLATGKLVGEGFDHPALETLVLAMPVSWKGTLQQYAGRLHREHSGKKDVRIIDFVDTGHPALLRMWDRLFLTVSIADHWLQAASGDDRFDGKSVDGRIAYLFSVGRLARLMVNSCPVSYCNTLRCGDSSVI